MKERVTITIDQHLLDDIDRYVTELGVKNRSQAIELMLAKTLQPKRITQAVLLAGGEESTPMLSINNKPVLDHLVSMLKRQGITDYVIVAGKLYDDVKTHFGDGENFGIKINYVKEKEPVGTAGAVKLAKEHLKGTFLVCYGDVLKRIDVKDMYSFHSKHDNKATMAVTTVSDPTKYGVVTMNGTSVHSFVEKPTGNVPSNLINSGVFLCEPEVLEYIPEGFAIFEQDVFPKLISEEQLRGYVFFGRWFDLQTQEMIEAAKKGWS